MEREFSRRARFAYVYISEAHAVDEWPISSARFNGDRGPVCIAQTHTLAARQQAARKFSDDFNLMDPRLGLNDEELQGRILVDDPELGLTFERAFRPWPVRFFVFQRDRTRGATVTFISEPRDGGFIDLSSLRSTLVAATAEEV